jgi:hypothetical protein
LIRGDKEIYFSLSVTIQLSQQKRATLLEITTPKLEKRKHYVYDK